jgi:hypothetical protein
MLFESLEGRRFLSATIAPNPSDQAPNDNAPPVAAASAAVTGNGVVVSDQAQAGDRADLVLALTPGGDHT